MIEESWFDSQQEQEISAYSTAIRPALGPSPISNGYWVLFPLRVKQPGCTDHSLSSSAKVTNEWSYTSIPPHTFKAWCLLHYHLKGSNLNQWIIDQLN